MGVIKGLFCSESAAGKECQNDKFCGDDEICVCNAKCESNRCIKGSREAEKTNDAKSPNGNGNKYGHYKYTNITGGGKSEIVFFFFFGLFILFPDSFPSCLVQALKKV